MQLSTKKALFLVKISSAAKIFEKKETRKTQTTDIKSDGGCALITTSNLYLVISLSQ